MPAQLAFVTAAQTLDARVCSGLLKAQLQTVCGTPAPAPAGGTQVTLSSTSSSLDFFSDAVCIGKPSLWVIPAGTSDLDVRFLDTAQGTPTMIISAPNLDAGTQVATINCPTGERPCGTACIPTANCCNDGDCTDGGIQYQCKSTGRCAPPPCSAFPAGCTSSDYLDATGSSANHTITFSSSGYTPKCLRPGSFYSVTFSGSFNIHPLRQVCGPTDMNMATSSGSTKSFNFPSTFGEYGYECANHPTFEKGAIKLP